MSLLGNIGKAAIAGISPATTLAVKAGQEISKGFKDITKAPKVEQIQQNPYTDEYMEQIRKQQQQEAYKPQDAKAAQIGNLQGSQAAQDQAALIQAIQAQMANPNSTLAQQNLSQNTANAIATQRAMAAGRTGASNLRGAERNIASQLQQQAGQSALLDEQQRQQAMSALAPLLQNQLGMEQQQALAQAQLEQQVNLANQQAGFNAAQLAQANQLGTLGAMGGLVGGLDQRALSQAQMQNQANIAEQQQRSQMLGSLLGAGASLGAAALSDQRAKFDIKDIKASDLKEFWKAYKPKEYKYKGKEDSQAGFMIQDIENTKLGKDMVMQADNGYRYYDEKKFAGILAATMKDLMEKRG